MEAHDTPESVLPPVKEALRLHLLSVEGDRLDELQVARVFSRPFSSIVLLNARTRRGVRRLVMKTTVHHPRNRRVTLSENQAIVEFEALARLHPRFSEVPGCGVPRPILVVPEVETYLMEFIEGQLLSEEHRWAKRWAPLGRFRALRRHYRRLGVWLKSFQRFTGLRFASTDCLQGVVERCRDRLQAIEERRDPLFPAELRETVEGRMRDDLAAAAGQEVPVSGRHGDFGPWNVIVSGSDVVVIDFLGYRAEPVAVDLLKVLVFLDDERRCFTKSPGRVQALRNAFLEGYGGLPPIPRPVLDLCETMQRVVNLLRRLEDRPARLHQRVERARIVQADVRWLLAGAGGRGGLLLPGETAVGLAPSQG